MSQQQDQHPDPGTEAIEAWRAFLEAWGNGELDSPAKAVPYIRRGRAAVARADAEQRQ